MSTLLLVEDDQSIVSSLSDYLGNEGFKIESASGQKEAVKKITGIVPLSFLFVLQ